jgi:cystathionine beta-lyase/cystathionine gamma-synthase
MTDDFEIESMLVHAGVEREPGAPLAPPLIATSAYISAGPPVAASAYGRDGNPTWSALEEGLGRLEGATAVVFASGQAAAMALMLALAPGKSRIILPSDGYYNIGKLAERLSPFGTTPVRVAALDLDAVRRELAAGAAILWGETPSNPLLNVADIAALADLAREAGAPFVVDNTVATGVLQRPLDLGATATLTSLTKGTSGHADLLLGSIATRDELLATSLREWRTLGGGIAGPFEAWLALRGLKTLPLRIVRQSENALAIARHLAEHARVRAVHYPGLEPATLELTRRQMPAGFGPLLSFELDGSADDADAVVGASRLIAPATSFGGVESTWERRARWSSEKSAPESLIRLSAGIEAITDLLTDIDRSLALAARSPG